MGLMRMPLQKISSIVLSQSVYFLIVLKKGGRKLLIEPHKNKKWQFFEKLADKNFLN